MHQLATLHALLAWHVVSQQHLEQGLDLRRPQLAPLEADAPELGLFPQVDQESYVRAGVLTRSPRGARGRVSPDAVVVRQVEHLQIPEARHRIQAPKSANVHRRQAAVT